MEHSSCISAGHFWPGIYKMGILDLLSKFKSKKEEASFEIDNCRFSVDDCNNRITVIMRDGTRNNAAEVLKNANDLRFIRFFICEEELRKPQFAPSLEEAIDWFFGKSYPNDGYRLTSWGKSSKMKCTFCESMVIFPFHIKKIERLTIYWQHIDLREIVGWRVSEVESEFGNGIPTKYFTIRGDHPVIKWDILRKKILCTRCAKQLEENDDRQN